jgi:mRNA-degrading endonuclease RelE of RelBE toxin-antitoxin system
VRRPYGLTVAPSASRSLDSLPERYAWALLVFIEGPLVENPYRVGRRLHFELTGRFGARIRPYRVVYRVDEGARLVIVERIEHRADVYRPR